MITDLNKSITESFTCIHCGHELDKSFCMRTSGYCYLCDPRIQTSELLSEEPIKRSWGWRDVVKYYKTSRRWNRFNRFPETSIRKKIARPKIERWDIILPKNP